MAISIAFSLTGLCFGQEKPKPASEQETPKLEIPEITIVGKKAITLPFARKGEIYDVDLFVAPPADSSLLGTPPSMSLLPGRLPRHENHDQPWRSSADAALGSFGTGHLNGYLDYKGDVWGLSANAGFASSNGHVDNSSFSKFDAGAAAHSIVTTDNAILKSFRTDAGLSYAHDSYGMFGIPGSPVRRAHSDVALIANIGTLNRTGSVLDINFATNFNSITDSSPSGDSSASVVSPVVRGDFSFPVKHVTISTLVSYTASSLTFQRPVNSPSTSELSIAASWAEGARWQFDVGGKISGGSVSKGDDISLLAPFGTAQYALDSSKHVRFWFRPDMKFATYGEHLEVIPYLAREIDLQPERRPAEVGGSFDLRDESLSLVLSATYASYSAKEIVVANGGYLTLEYPQAAMSTFAIEGSFAHARSARFDFAGTLISAHETGKSTQLPMVPVTKVTAREEISVVSPVSLWASLNFEGAKNTDRDGVSTIPSAFLVNCGAYTSIARKIVLGVEITNLFNVNYEWWKDYPAPRFGFNVTARANIQ